MYDEDERIASQAATTMCERGFENLFMLSGGESLWLLFYLGRLCIEVTLLFHLYQQRVEGGCAEVP